MLKSSFYVLVCFGHDFSRHISKTQVFPINYCSKSKSQVQYSYIFSTVFGGRRQQTAHNAQGMPHQAEETTSSTQHTTPTQRTTKIQRTNTHTQTMHDTRRAFQKKRKRTHNVHIWVVCEISMFSFPLEIYTYMGISYFLFYLILPHNGNLLILVCDRITGLPHRHIKICALHDVFVVHRAFPHKDASARASVLGAG